LWALARWAERMRSAAVGIERRTDDHVKAALLDAADMIRILRIILDGKE